MVSFKQLFPPDIDLILFLLKTSTTILYQRFLLLEKSLIFLTGVCDSAQWLSRCEFFKLGEYRKCVAVSANHRLAEKKKRLSLSDLYGENLMMVKEGGFSSQ